MLEDVPPLVPEKFTVREKERKLWIETSDCDGIVGLDEFGFSILGKDGRVIYRQENHDCVLDFTHESFPFGFVENPNLGGLESDAGVWLIRKSGTEKKQGVIGSCRVGV